MSATVYLCTNAETAAGSYLIDYSDRDAVADAGSDAAASVLEAGGVVIRPVSWFRDWNGGKYSSSQCGRTIDGDTYGYTRGLVATLEKNPTPELIALIDNAADAYLIAMDNGAATCAERYEN